MPWSRVAASLLMLGLLTQARPGHAREGKQSGAPAAAPSVCPAPPVTATQEEIRSMDMRLETSLKGLATGQVRGEREAIERFVSSLPDGSQTTLLLASYSLCRQCEAHRYSEELCESELRKLNDAIIASSLQRSSTQAGDPTGGERLASPAMAIATTPTAATPSSVAPSETAALPPAASAQHPLTAEDLVGTWRFRLRYIAGPCADDEGRQGTIVRTFEFDTWRGELRGRLVGENSSPRICPDWTGTVAEGKASLGCRQEAGDLDVPASSDPSSVTTPAADIDSPSSVVELGGVDDDAAPAVDAPRDVAAQGRSIPAYDGALFWLTQQPSGVGGVLAVADPDEGTGSDGRFVIEGCPRVYEVSATCSDCR